jgi:ABC-type transport system involved in multi-copper enzyme maturation permease subunit
MSTTTSTPTTTTAPTAPSTAASTAAPRLRPPALDLTATARVPLARLVGVELRKLGDTRAGRWLMIAIALITLAAVTVFALVSAEPDRTLVGFLGVAAAPQGFLLPVLGILLVTSEWSQRTALVSFTLEPRRARVVAAKVLASLLAGAVAIAVALALAAVATLVAGSSTAWDGVTAATLGKFAILQVSWVLQGLAFGLVFLASAPAIVTYLVLPSAFTLLAQLWTGLAPVRPWIDLGFSQLFLYEPSMTGEQWGQLATGTALWILLPLALGLRRVLRAEVK